jgi:diguanylate cyclase (GGDEF)-like protein
MGEAGTQGGGAASDEPIVKNPPGEELGLPAQLRRERLADIERRLDTHRRWAFGVTALALLACLPSLGLLVLAPLVAAAVLLAAMHMIMQRTGAIDHWATVLWCVSPVLIGASVALTGGPESPATVFFALPAVTVAVRFPPRGVLIGTAWTLLVLFASTIPVDPDAAFGEPARLIFPFAATIATVILSTAIAESERRFRHEAVVDPLTGLLNRAALSERFAELEQRVERGEEPPPLGFLIGDIDNFKAINDRHGHDIGDVVLREAASAMRDSLRTLDLVFRVGGEEFVVLLPGSDLGKAMEIAERLRAAVAERSLEAVPVTISFGVAATTDGELDFERLYRQADLALYAAKRGGRDRACASELLTAVS